MGAFSPGIDAAAEPTEFNALMQHSANVRALVAESLAAFNRAEFAGCASDLSALRDEVRQLEAAIEQLQSLVDGRLSEYRHMLRTGQLAR